MFAQVCIDAYDDKMNMVRLNSVIPGTKECMHIDSPTCTHVDARCEKHTFCNELVNRLTPRDAYLHKRCVYHYQRILPYPLKDYTNLKLFMFTFITSVYIAEIHFLLPTIPLLSHLADFGQLYFSLTKNIPALIG